MARPRKSIKITELIEIVNSLNSVNDGLIIIRNVPNYSPERRIGWNTLLQAALQRTNSDAGYQLTNVRDRSRIQFHIHPALIEKVEETTNGD